MSRFFSCALLASLCLIARAVRISPISLINAQGLSKSSSVFDQQIRSALSQSSSSSSSSSSLSKRLLAVVDCASSQTEDCKLVNSVLDTNFSVSSNGVSLEITEDAAVLRSCFDHMFSSEFCGSKAADWSVSLGCPVCVALRTTDTEESMRNNDQIFRRVASQLQKTQPLVVLVQSSSVPTVVREAVRSAISAIVADMGIQNFDYSRVRVLSISDSEDLEEVKNELRTIMSAQEPLDVSQLGTLAVNKWRQVSPSPLPLLSKEESLYDVELAFVDVLRLSQEGIDQLQKRVSRGKIIAKFPQRVKALLSMSMAEFNRRVEGGNAIRERAQRASMIREFVIAGAAQLFEQQVLLKEFSALGSVKQSLAALYSKAADKVPAEELQALIRREVFDFKTSVGELEDESLGLQINQAKVTEFKTKVETMVNEYGESAEAKLLELKNLEGKVVAKKKEPKPQRSLLEMVRVGMSLVGMLRPHGFGNLQGIFSYSMSLLGFPVDFMLGVQNDGDSLEVMGEDREHPLLRLQPKFNFEIDL